MHHFWQYRHRYACISRCVSRANMRHANEHNRVPVPTPILTYIWYVYTYIRTYVHTLIFIYIWNIQRKPGKTMRDNQSPFRTLPIPCHVPITINAKRPRVILKCLRAFKCWVHHPTWHILNALIIKIDFQGDNFLPFAFMPFNVTSFSVSYFFIRLHFARTGKQNIRDE